jgi:threonine synthase
MSNMRLRCAACQRTCTLGPLFQGCPSCGGALEVEYDYAALAPAFNAAWANPLRLAAGIWRYASLLPIDDRADIVSLGEGRTPLVHSRRIGPRHGLQQLFFKNETVNPTWAQKDRCHTVMLTKAREFGYRRVVTCSTGNHGASAAAYTAAAGHTAGR